MPAIRPNVLSRLLGASANALSHGVMLCEVERDFDRECAWQESNLRKVPARDTPRWRGAESVVCTRLSRLNGASALFLG